MQFFGFNICYLNKCIEDDTKAAARQSSSCIKKPKKIKYGENDFRYGGWNYYTLQCGTIVTLISPGDCTLQCGMWLWNHDSEFTKWQHLAMWYVALGWHANEFARWQHPAMWQVALGWQPWNSLKRPPYWNSTFGFDFDDITAVDISLCTSMQNFIQIGPPSAEKHDVMSIIKMADLSHLGF